MKHIIVSNIKGSDGVEIRRDRYGDDIAVTFNEYQWIAHTLTRSMAQQMIDSLNIYLDIEGNGEFIVPNRIK